MTTTLGIRPLDASFGAEITGLRIAGNVPEAEFQAYLDALHREIAMVAALLPAPRPADPRCAK